MKGKNIICAAAIVTGALIGNALKTQNEFVNPMTLQRVDNLRSRLETVKSQVKVNDEIIKALKSNFERLETVTDDKKFKEYLGGALEELKMISASHAVEGEGVEIILNDSGDIIMGSDNAGIIHDIDILNLLNDLRISGAEAISINEERIVESTEIKCGGPIIRINGVSKGTPFVIKAVGDKERLYAGVYGRDGYAKLLEDVYRIGVKVMKRDKLYISPRGDIR